MSQSRRTLWQRIEEFLPDLTPAQQTVVTEQMHHNALATVDFYILIALSSAIAFFGLLLDSGAVVIGAMLVAPLMSPMMAVGFGIVSGNLPQLSRAFFSTVAGALLAIGIGTLFAFLLPLGEPSAEIIARTQPTLLDLLVALVSGLAGAYALSRKEVAASLPGVAIAAALVPPLNVVGYGIGTGQWQYAQGALLLFLTNLASIVLAGAVMFLLLGFRPKKEGTLIVRRSLLITIIGLVLISIPLTVTTVQQTVQTRRQTAVEGVLRGLVANDSAEIEDITITSVEDGFVIGFTVYAYSEAIADQTDVARLQERLSDAVGAPITLRARVVPAFLANVRDFALPNVEP